MAAADGMRPSRTRVLSAAIKLADAWRAEGASMGSPVALPLKVQHALLDLLDLIRPGDAPEPLHAVFEEIVEERRRQIEKFPAEERGLPDGTGGIHREKQRRLATLACDQAQSEGRLTHAYILDEETAEVLAETDPVKLRVELIQVAAVCCKWVGQLDRDYLDRGGSR